MKIEELKKEYVTGVYETKSLLIKKDPITLKSGNISHIYLNHNNFLIHNKYLKVVAQLYAELIAKHVESYALGVVDSIMSPIIVGAISTITNKDIVAINTKANQHGVKDSIFGNPKQEIVLIDDMTSTGGTIEEVANILRQHGANISYAIVSASRNDQAKINLSKQGIDLISLFSFQEILSLLENQLSSKEKEIVKLEEMV